MLTAYRRMAAACTKVQRFLTLSRIVLFQDLLFSWHSIIADLRCVISIEANRTSIRLKRNFTLESIMKRMLTMINVSTAMTETENA